MKILKGILIVLLFYATAHLILPVSANYLNDPILTVAEYPIDEVDGTVVNDTLGNDYIGIIIGASHTPGLSGNGILFNGTSYYIDVPILFFPENGFTIKTWVNTSSLNMQMSFGGSSAGIDKYNPVLGVSYRISQRDAGCVSYYGALGTISVSGVVTYTPTTDHFSSDSFTTFTANNGARDSAQDMASILVNRVPAASFTATPTYGDVPLAVNFTDTSTNSPTEWAWYFGDERWASWTQMNASPGWSGRHAHSSVVFPDGSIVLMGGYPNTNDVWRSTDNGATWTCVNASAGWSTRYGQSSVVLPNGNIVLMGGNNGSSWLNDVWHSTDKGATWTCVNASAGWSARGYHSSVVLHDGSIVLMGGYPNTNDIWRSIDNGVTWTCVNASAGWSTRYVQSSVVLPDDSIVLVGGVSSEFSYNNDVWRSIDNGVTWTCVNASAGWSTRYGQSSVVLPDGSIVVMGGYNGSSYTNEVWRSTDNGAIWTQLASAGWSGRHVHSSVVFPDGSIVVMGGNNNSELNDVWRLPTSGSLEQNPSHRYTAPGTYNVSLIVTNARGSNTITMPGLITVNAITPVANFTARKTSSFTPLFV